VADLAKAGYLSREREGRRNLYTVRSDVPLGLPIQRDIDIASLLALLPSQDDPNENRSPQAASTSRPPTPATDRDSPS
jgi:hypothetical protein